MEYIDLGLPSGNLWGISEDVVTVGFSKRMSMATVEDIIELQSYTPQSIYKGHVRLKGSNGNVLAVQIKVPYRITSTDTCNMASWRKNGKIFVVEWNKIQDSLDVRALLVKKTK